MESGTVVVVTLIAVAISLGIHYLIVNAATRNALTHHYKMVRWYEKTGEWRYKTSYWKDHPRAFDTPEDEEEPQV